MSPPPAIPRTPPPTTPQALPQSQLAALLTEAYRELEVHRADASSQRDRANKAEKLVKTLTLLRGPSSPSTTAASAPQITTDDAIRLVHEHEERANRAEQERDEAIARRVAISDYWIQLHSFLTELDNAAVDARMGFDRIVKENGGQLVLAKIPTLSGADSLNGQRISRQPPLPPHTLPPAPTMRRARTPSLDSYNPPPPTKRSRAEFTEPVSIEPFYHHPCSSSLLEDPSLHFPQPAFPPHALPPSRPSTLRPRTSTPTTFHPPHDLPSRPVLINAAPPTTLDTFTQPTLPTPRSIQPPPTLLPSPPLPLPIPPDPSAVTIPQPVQRS